MFTGQGGGALGATLTLKNAVEENHVRRRIASHPTAVEEQGGNHAVEFYKRGLLDPRLLSASLAV